MKHPKFKTVVKQFKFIAMKKQYVLLIVINLLATVGFSQSQAEMNDEALNSYKLADQEMTTIYKSTMANLGTQAEKNLLLAAQRAWITYKEAHCEAIAHQYEGGSMQPLIYYGCLENLTNERIIQLEQYEE
jgi:uncharacterized protein YecT (DUF1311 family)